MIDLIASVLIADATPQQIRWCDLPKPGQSIVLIHQVKAWSAIQELVPPGAKATRCKWWIKKPSDVPTELSIQIGFFSNPKNAQANATEIYNSLFADSNIANSRVVEVYENKRVQQRTRQW